MTLSARIRMACGIATPIVRAVLALMTNSTEVGNSTGKSPALAPFRIFATYVADIPAIRIGRDLRATRRQVVFEVHGRGQSPQRRDGEGAPDHPDEHEEPA